MKGSIPQNKLSELSRLGRSCADWRRAMRIPQREIANLTGYTVQAVSAFERGMLNNGLILAGYCRKGYEFGKG